MKRKRLTAPWIVRVGVVAAAVVAGMGASAPPSSAAPTKRPMVVVARDFQFLGVPWALPAGQYDLRFFNIGREDHVFVAVNLGPTCSSTIATVTDAKALLGRIGAAEDPEAALSGECPGSVFEGAAFAPGGSRAREDFSLTPGKTIYFCDVADDGVSHSDLGMIGLINVFRLPTHG